MTGPANATEPGLPSPSPIDEQRHGWRRRSPAAATEGRILSAGPVVTELTTRGPSEKSPLEVEFDDQVRTLLVRIDAQEVQARAAQADLGTVRTWPSWSMDTGLTEAQETFVEAWSPERVLETSQSTRQLVLILQHWTRTHRDDTELDEALTILAALPGL